MQAKLKTKLTLSDVTLAGVMISLQDWQTPKLLGLWVGPHVPSATPGSALQARAAESARVKRRPNRAAFRRVGSSQGASSLNHFTNRLIPIPARIQSAHRTSPRKPPHAHRTS